VTSIRILTVIGLTLIWTGIWPSTFASAQVVERGVQGAAVGAIIGGIVGGGRGAGTGAAIGAGVGVLSGAAEANARAHGYYGPPPPGYYGPPPARYHGPPPARYHGPPPPARAAIGVSINIAPPVLPVYEQPLCPGPGYIWTPGYWAYGEDDYYWVPGTWVLPPAVGLLWTPGYWGYGGGVYVWHAGYWGPHIGYYGGVNYGFGYGGVGYEGGYWNHGVFFYNSAVTKVNKTVITNVYSKTVIKNQTVNNVSFNGPGGTKAQPTAQELAWSHEQHTRPTTLQLKHQQTAKTNRSLFASVNHGAPPVVATAKPGVFTSETGGPKGVKGKDNATVATGTTSQTSLDGKQHGTDHKALRHGLGGPGSSFGSEEPRGGPHGQDGSHGPRGPFASGGPGPYDGRHGPGGPNGAGPNGPGGPKGGTPVAQGAPGSHGKPNQHDPEGDQHDQER
jgi:WXXGXW repeat (2 copies)